jgi:hypothetical protein
LFLSCNSKGPDSIPSLEKLLSKNYSVRVSGETLFYSKKDSVFLPKKTNGILKRSGDYLYSKLDSGTVILQDSTILFIDNVNKMISIGPQVIENAFLISPVHDPYQIWEYSVKYNEGFIKHYENGKLVYDFVFQRKDEAMLHVIFSFDPKEIDGQTTTVNLVYFRRNVIVHENIHYEFVPNIEIETDKNINDFMEHRNDRYSTKSGKYFSGYALFDSFLLQKNKK